jgi:uncharacterized repeat protein (TIGR04138 family)
MRGSFGVAQKVISEQRALQQFERMVHEDGRYPREAYAFLQAGLEYTSRLVHGTASSRKPRHVSGQQLCLGLRELARQRWGLLAADVLANWSIHTTRDFGEMVFLLIQNDLLGKQDSDAIEDFNEVFCFQDAFGSYQIQFSEGHE